MRLSNYSLALISMTAMQADLLAQDNCKSFPVYHCKYTLPGKNWSWMETKAQSESLFLARNSEGIRIDLTVQPATPQMVIDEKFVEDLKKEINNLENFKFLE